MEHKDYFEDKKITVVGLGLLGRGVGDIAFLARHGADLIVTDLKSEVELQESLEQLKEYPAITYRLGEHDLRDFKDRDMIIKAAGVPLDSPYIAEARKNDIAIEMSTALFARLSGTTLVGVTGTRGKSTVTHLLYEVLQEAGKTVHLGGNIRGVSTLAQLETVERGDWVVMELDSWQLQGFGESGLSPQYAVFTNLMSDHMNYYNNDMELYWRDKANIFMHQKQGDVVVAGEEIAPRIKISLGDNSERLLVAGSNTLPADWKPRLIGEHNKKNIGLAIQMARLVGISDDIIQRAVENFTGVSGRLELIREVGGVKFYNDTTATTPDATRAALQALSDPEHTILIMGGADKKLDMSELVSELSAGSKTVVLLPGTGTDTLDLSEVTSRIIRVETLQEAVEQAVAVSTNGDSIVLSPAFASFGLFKNEFDRGEQFVALVNEL